MTLLLEKDKIELEEKRGIERSKVLEEDVKIGKSAERLLSNLDWQRFASKLEAAVKDREGSIQSLMIQSIIDSDTTETGDHKACNAIRKAWYELVNFNFILNLPKEEARVGMEAEKELSNLRGGQNG